MAGLDELVSNLYEMVQDAWSVPFGADRCMLDREKVLDILDEIRVNLPNDLKIARDIVDKRNEVIAAGKREADAIKKHADEYSKQLINENAIVAEAKKKAAEIVRNAEMKAQEVKKVANDYCEDSLKRTEDVVEQALAELRKSRQQFKSISRS